MVEYRGIDRFPSYLFGSDGTILRKGRGLLKQRLKASGYFDAPLCESGRYHVKYAHRLICEAFHGAPPPKHECRHINGDKADNRAENLAWGTKKQNEADKEVHGTRLRGEAFHAAKLTERGVIEARRAVGRGETLVSVAARLGIGASSLYAAVSGKNWKHLPGSIPQRHIRWNSNRR